MMNKDIFRTVRELLVNRDEVLLSNAVDTEGKLYADSVENLHALEMLEASLLELVGECRFARVTSKALEEIVELIGWEG